MSPKHISYIASICLLLIIATQAYLVCDYYETTRAGLVRESNAILQEAFRKDLSIRSQIYKHSVGEDTLKTPPPSTKENTASTSIKLAREYKDNLTTLLDLTINNFISKSVPINLNNLDSLTGTILASRQIHSAYIINLVDPTNNQVLQQSEKEFTGSFLVVPSKLLQIDLENKKSLQLILVNPFGIIIKRMALMLLSSLALSFICLFAFRFLLITLARQKKLVAFKNEFLGTIAHELKRPVASLTVNLDCLTMPAFAEDKAKRELLVSKSINATTELNDTIYMIVALAKVEEGLLVPDKQLIDLQQLFEELKARFLNNAYKSVKIQTVYEGEGLLMVIGDRRLLSQCFANLIDNAIKYSSNEVRLTITIRKEANRIAISIKDNGFGISPEKLPFIFDKYSRAHTDNAKINGYGIGLNYVKTIVEKHKGEVNVKSEVDVGSEFMVRLDC
jgi:two-component system, OmpR family, phosphate regulon sensor histidine kinase PhoR